MFATLLGSLPRPPLAADAPRRALVEAVVRAQETAGIEPVTDGGLPGASDPVAAWQATASLTERAVKQALRGPYSLAWSPDAGAAQRTTATLANAAAGNAILTALAAAGCPLIEIHEPSATAIGADAAGARAVPRGPPATPRRRRRDPPLAGHHRRQRRRRRGRDDPRRSIREPRGRPHRGSGQLASRRGRTGRHRDRVRRAVAGRRTATTAPRCCCGRRPTRPRPEGAGADRVGLATASSLAGLPWPDAVRKIERLGAAARLAEVPASEAVASLDPRAVSSRAAALGYVGPEPSRGPRPDDDPT